MNKRRWLSLTLSAVMALSMAVPASAAPVETPIAVEETSEYALSLDNVVSIQAYTAGTYYGTGLTQVDITYKDGVDVSAATAEDYVLTDRGTLNPDFGELNISDVTVAGQVVTLNISDLTDATENNKMVYTGDDKEGSRERNAFGVYCTGAWYRDAAGVIYYGSSDDDEYENNTTGRGYQARETLELKLQVVGEDTVESLATDLGTYNADGKWLETIDTQLGEGGFQPLTDLQIVSTAADADWSEVEQAKEDAYVRGYYYVPENYDPAAGIVFTLQGQGISYWNLKDGSDNDGTGFMYDCATASWANKGAIVVNIHDRSSQQALAEGYDFVVDDVNVMKYFIEKYNVTGNIVLQGNSRGTMASNIVIKALAGCMYNPKQQQAGLSVEMDRQLDKSVYDFEIDTYICQNGTLGGAYWTDEDLAAIVDTGLKVWAFDGEQDTNNIETIATYKAACEAAGYGEAWIKENVRHTGLASELTYYWGESDHSATRTNGWYFANAAYYGPYLHIDEATGEIVYDQKLEDGDTYTLQARGTAATNGKAEYEYTVYDDLFQEWALEAAAVDSKFHPTDIADVEVPAYEKTDDPNQLPLTGYYKMALSGDYANREVRFYIPDTAILRPYFHFIAVPDGVDADEFIVESGWKQIADETGECLYILLPDQTTGIWGDVEDEVGYITAAKAKHGSNGGYFTTFGEFYLTGYGAGATCLEAWAAINPNLVIAQTYIGGGSEGYDALAASGEEFFGYTSMTDGDIRDRDGDGVNERVNEDGTQKIMYQFTERLSKVWNVDAGENAGLLKKADFPVPSFFVNNTASDNEAYWMSVNKADTVDEQISKVGDFAVSGTVANEKEITWATEYAGNISKVVSFTTEADTMSYEFTRTMRDEMAMYTRYDNTISYGNGLMLRLDYTEAQHERYTSDAKYGEQEVTGVTLAGEEVKGTVSIQEMVASDGYYSDLLMYVPETAGDKDIPVIVVWHGGSQNGHLFMDSTCWWQTAAAEGFAIVFPTRTYKNTESAHDAVLWDATLDILEADGRFDMTRVYTSGQSMGGIATTTIEMYRTSELAAGVATNAGNVEPDLVMECGVPAGLVIGEGNYALRGIPGYEADTNYEEDNTTQMCRSTEAAAAGADIYWDDVMARMTTWETFFEKWNNLSKESIRDTILYRGASILNQGTNGEGTLADWNTNNARLRTWYWDNEDGIPIMMYTMAMYQAHNCQPSYRPIIWDYVKHYSVVTENGYVTRYYSESGFEEDDAVVIEHTLLPIECTDIDSITELATDYSQAAQLPETGYFYQNFEVNGETRTVKLYLSDTISVRPYYTIVAVPDGVDTDTFLTDKGWFALADEQGEGLLILEPGENGWGSAEDEQAYVAQAYSLVSGGKNANGVAIITTFGEYYLAGYGKGASALELWAAANPILVIAQTYYDGESAGAEALEAVASDLINGKSSNGDISDVLDETLETVGIAGQIAKKDIAVPTILVGYTGSEEYWKTANDCVATAVDGVYAQDIDADNYATDYANSVRKAAGETTGLSQVKVVASTEETALETYTYMAQWTRYDTTFSYSNALAPRLDYSAAKVEAQTEAKDGNAQTVLSDGTEILGVGEVAFAGHGTVQMGVFSFSDQDGDGKNDPREYLLYVPEGYEGKELPIVMVYPGNSQTDIIFMDSTSWWQIAEQKGFAVAFVCETYSSAVAVSHFDNIGFYNALISVLKETVESDTVKFDYTRIYGTGQSAGSNATQTIAMENPELFSAVASTSGAPFSSATTLSGQIPTMMITGQMDAGSMAKGFDDTTGLVAWGNYFLAAAGIDATFAADTASSVTSVDSRHTAVYAWDNSQGITMLQWGQCLLRPHNCYPSDMPILWDYLEHYSMDENGVRYYSESAFEKDDAVVIEQDTVDLQSKVVDVKATVAPNFYGFKVSQVVITFEEDVNPVALELADINVWDRGSANPNFGTLNCVEKTVDGNVVTLTFNTDSDKLTDRSRNSFGMMNTTGWYMDSEGNIYYGSEDSTDNMGNKLYANENSKTCQPKALELVLTIDNELADGIFSTDMKGNKLANTVWEEEELTGGLEKVETRLVDIGSFAEGYTQVSDEGLVPVQLILPEGYDVNRAEAYPVIVYQCGGGVCYWELAAGTKNNIADANNLGCNTVYDNMMTEWAEMYPEAVIMAVNIHSTNTEVSAAEINSVIRYGIENWNLAEGKAILVGNSQGTILGSDAIRQAPELYAGFVECNGNFGANIQVTQTDGTVANSSFCNWTEDEVAALIANDVSCWMWNGETDGTNAGVAQDTYAVLADLYAAKGYSDEWIKNHVRVSGLQSWKFKEWGETDHSVTKVVAWNYIANPYTDVYENASIQVGDTYKFTGKESYNYYDYTMDFNYMVYAESVSEWAKNLIDGVYDETITPEVKDEQNIITAFNKKTITKAYGDAAFNLGARTTGNGKITYKSSNSKIAKVDKNGKVTIKGTGIATITIKAAETENRAAATLKIKVKVTPKKAKVSSAKAGKKSITVKVKKDSRATGYQVQVSTSVNFTKKTTTTKTLKKNTTVSTTVKNLKSGKTYYVRTRSYKTVNGTKIYGAYSAVKTVKVK